MELNLSSVDSILILSISPGLSTCMIVIVSFNSNTASVIREQELLMLPKTKPNETKRNRTKRNEIKQNETKPNEAKRNRSKRNETRCNEKKETKPNKTKRNRTKRNVTKKNEKFNMAWRLRGLIIYWSFCLISFRFVRFRFVSFGFVLFLFRFTLYRYPLDICTSIKSGRVKLALWN
jgi:hypothetical protein